MAETSFDAVSGSLNSKPQMELICTSSGISATGDYTVSNLQNYKWIYLRVVDADKTRVSQILPISFFTSSTSEAYLAYDTRMDANRCHAAFLYVSDTVVKCSAFVRAYGEVILLYGIK